MDYYAILGISRDASKEEIKKAMRGKAREHHPDHNGGASNDEFHKVKQAYDILSNPVLKQEYDTYGFTREDNTAKQLRGMAMDIIGELIKRGVSPDLTINKAEELVSESIGHLERDMGKLETKIDQLKDRKNRLKPKSNLKIDIIGQALDISIKKEESALVGLKTNYDFHQKLLKVIRDYEKGEEPVHVNPGFGTAVAFGTGAW
ncbi:DnaJ domain-containing protein [Candidatus Pacearchaeota archaeon]|nr:DnaJ domain-containing protein [Candidatus Pacearchaeota archaeon]